MAEEAGANNEKPQTNSTRDDDESVGKGLLNRRSYLQLAGTAAIATAAGVGTVTGADTSYDVITVPAGETYRISVGDNETFENTLIDITADGADLTLSAKATNWTVQNVGVIGQVEAYDDPPFFVCRDESSDGTSRIRNCYFGDGGKGDIGDRAGIYVHSDHAGTLEIDNVYVANFKDNGIYASPPGNPETALFYPGHVGKMGTVEVTNSYFENNVGDAIRLGSPGSFAENCVAVDHPHRGFWQYWRESEWRNCDAYDCARSFEASEDQNVPDTTTVMHLENCRANTPPQTEDGARIDGTLGDSPRSSPPTGVPMSAKDAAAGTSNDDTNNSDDTDNQTSQTLRVESAPDLSSIEYEFVVEGTVTRGPGAESEETITETDGQTVVTGETGYGYADDFEFEGDLVDWTANVAAESYTVLVDGAAIDPGQFETTTPSTLRVESAPDLSSIEYEFVVDGTVTRGPGAESEETITETDGQTVVTGETGYGYADDFEFEGDLVDWTANVAAESYTVLVDGTAIDPGQFAPTPSTLTVETNEGGPLVRYEFVVDGTVSRGANAEQSGSVASDSISVSGDQTAVSGTTGDGYVDNFDIDGSVVNWTAEVDTDHYRLKFDGEEVDPTSL